MALVLAACGQSQEPAAPAPAAAAPPFHTTLTTKQLMSWIIDPNAAAIWNSVGSITTERDREKHPQTDEEWSTYRNAAAMLIESGNLLMLDGVRWTTINGWPRHAGWRTRRLPCSKPPRRRTSKPISTPAVRCTKRAPPATRSI
jgi:hypothetical protein